MGERGETARRCCCSVLCAGARWRGSVPGSFDDERLLIACRAQRCRGQHEMQHSPCGGKFIRGTSIRKTHAVTPPLLSTMDGRARPKRRRAVADEAASSLGGASAPPIAHVDSTTSSDAASPPPPIGVFTGRRCDLLSQLCHPLSPARFKRLHWRRKGFVAHGPSTRLHNFSRDHLCGLSLRGLLTETPSEQIHVWFTSPHGGGNQSFKVGDADAAISCHKAGGSLYFRAPPPAADLLVTALSQAKVSHPFVLPHDSSCSLPMLLAHANCSC